MHGAHSAGRGLRMACMRDCSRAPCRRVLACAPVACRYAGGHRRGDGRAMPRCPGPVCANSASGRLDAAPPLASSRPPARRHAVRPGDGRGCCSQSQHATPAAPLRRPRPGQARCLSCGSSSFVTCARSSRGPALQHSLLRPASPAVTTVGEQSFISHRIIPRLPLQAGALRWGRRCPPPVALRSHHQQTQLLRGPLHEGLSLR
jgi:hypothetical protein